MIEPEIVGQAPETMWPHMQDKNVFTVEIGGFYKYLIIAITDTTGFGVFAEEYKDNVFYKYDMTRGSSTDPIYCGREYFLDKIGEMRPECFDWLLFNQEWL